MTGQPAVVVCADDFGMTEGISTTIAELLEAGALNATTCLVEAPAWRTCVDRLRELAADRPTIAVGLHLELASPWVSSAAALAAFDRQWREFEACFGQPPDFVDGHRHAHLFPGPRSALFHLLARTGARCWLRQCRTSSEGAGLKRLVLDPLSAQFRKAAELRGHMVNPGFAGLRRFAASEDVAAIWRRDLRALNEGGVLMTHPGPIDPDEPLSACRDQEAALLAQGAVAAAMAECGLSMANAKTPWPPAH